MKSQYPAAAQAIRAWIEGEKMRPGAVLPSGDALAARFGINRMIAIRACQHLISSGLLRREGYRLLVKSERPTEPDLGTVYVASYYEEFTRSAERILTERGLSHRLIRLSWTKQVFLAPALKQILSERPAGVILAVGHLEEEEPQSILRKTTIPTVICINEDLPPLPQSSVQIDLRRGTEKALRHLFELGHRRIAHATFACSSRDKEQLECYQAACARLNLKAASSMIWQVGLGTGRMPQEMLRERRRQHPEVTAIFCDDRLGILATEAFDVPRELSVVGLGGMAAGADCRPPLTTLALADPDCLARWACSEMIQQLQARAVGRAPRPPSQVLFVLDLVPRKSTRALGKVEVTLQSADASQLPKQDPAKTWQTVYPFVRKNKSDIWLQLNLAKLANHSMSRQYGWLGAEPLEHFPAGLRSVHGVPFQVLDESKNGGRAVVTFRSPHAHSAGKRQLPTRAKIEVGARVKAIYFLHGCGYAQPVPFAKYIMHYRIGESREVPLIPLGSSRQEAAERLGDLRPNLQDWWPDYEQQDFPHAHQAIVFNPAGFALYERSLYSLEWINPQPQDEIKSIEVEVDPEGGPTLALIAVTALLRKAGRESPDGRPKLS